MRLHVFPGSPNCKKVMLANELLGLNLETRVVDLQSGAQKTPEFLALNPHGKVPVLEYDDGTTLWESNAIVDRLAGEKDTTLWPKSNDRYDIMRWQFWEACHWTPACTPFISKYLFKNDDVDLGKPSENFQFFAGVLDTHLANRQWLATEHMTTADISVCAVLCYRELCQYPMGPFEHIARWIDQIERLPAWQKINS